MAQISCYIGVISFAKILAVVYVLRVWKYLKIAAVWFAKK
jgi:hypothetical protein